MKYNLINNLQQLELMRAIVLFMPPASMTAQMGFSSMLS
jgi:hypothetical protein